MRIVYQQLFFQILLSFVIFITSLTAAAQNISIEPIHSGNSAEVFAGMQTSRSGEESSQSNAYGQFAGGANSSGAGSSLSANNISLTAGENILAVGSDLIAMPTMPVLPGLPPQGGNLILDAGNDITTLASVNDDSLSTYEERTTGDRPRFR